MTSMTGGVALQRLGLVAGQQEKRKLLMDQKAPDRLFGCFWQSVSMVPEPITADTDWRHCKRVGSRCAMMLAAERSDISCSLDWPPYSTAT